MKFPHAAGIGAFLLAALAASGQEPATSRWSRAEEALGLMASRHLVPDESRLRKAVLDAVVTSADPGGGVLGREDVEARERSGRGLRPNLGWRFSSTNHLVTLREPAAASASAPGCAGWVVTAVNGRTTVTNSWSAVMKHLRTGAAPSVLLGLTDPVKGTVTNITFAMTTTPEEAVALREVWLGDLLYVRVNGLYPRSAPDLLEALKPFSGLRGVLLDLRDAGGDDQECALALAGLVCSGASPAARWTGLDDTSASDLLPAASPSPGLDAPVLVLLNRSTHGAAELLAALLSHCGSGVMVIGEPPAGDPLLREAIPLAGSFMLVATRKLVFADGVSLDARTILQPDIVVNDRDVDDPLVADDHAASQNHRRADDTSEHSAQVRLLDRIRHDAVLKRAVDVMLGLRAMPARKKP
ncbi:MAG: S41 family peptidase [Kiritimatiellia bacterium]